MQSHERVLALDGLRAVSILIVACSHILSLAGVEFIPGGFGVTVFFFISGFIITRLLLQEHADTGRINLLSFYLRRFFRLAPALLVYVAVSVVAMSSLGLRIPGSDVLAVLLYYANYHNIWTGFVVKGADAVFSPLAITWSLAIEEHFYFLFPVILVIMRNRTARLVWLLCTFVVAVALWRTFLVFKVGLAALPPNRIYMATDTRLDSIAYGCLLSVLFYRGATESNRSVVFILDLLRSRVALCATAVLLLLSFMWRGPEVRETLRYSMQGIAMIPLFCSLFWKTPAPRWLQLPLESQPMLFIGAISYSLYLYHFLALALVQSALSAAAPYLQIPVAWFLAIGGSIFSYYVVEGPARRFGSRLATRTSISLAVR
jgi:peptidoglycan/LPS O-acetylase OafA/YrhL